MKRTLFISGCFFALTYFCFAQDVIVTRSGTRINSNVLRITDDNVFFKYFDNPSGSTYSISKNDVSQILYQNGQRESFDINTRPQTTTPVQSQSQQRQTQTAPTVPDIITMKSGYKINATVREITQSQVQFYLFTEPNGELYYVNKNEVTNILYRDGRTETFAVAFTEPANRQRTTPTQNQPDSTHGQTQSSRNQTTDTTPVQAQSPREQTATSLPVQIQNQETTLSNQYQTQNQRTQTTAYLPVETLGIGFPLGFKGTVEIGHQFGTDDYGSNRLKINVILGSQVNPYFSFGLGLGMRYYYAGAVVDGRFYGTGTAIPMLADFRIYFMDNRLSPYLSLGLGFSYFLFDSFSSSFEGFGALLNPTVGVSYMISKKFAVNAGLGYEIQSTINSSAIGIVVGISF